MEPEPKNGQKPLDPSNPAVCADLCRKLANEMQDSENGAPSDAQITSALRLLLYGLGNIMANMAAMREAQARIRGQQIMSSLGKGFDPTRRM